MYFIIELGSETRKVIQFIRNKFLYCLRHNNINSIYAMPSDNAQSPYTHSSYFQVFFSFPFYQSQFQTTIPQKHTQMVSIMYIIHFI